MTGLRLYPIAFGGMAFEPVTDAGKAFCRRLHGSRLFRAPDACMMGFDAGSVGWEPWATPDILDYAKARGLTITEEDGQ